jgi:hypothetical protein
MVLMLDYLFTFYLFICLSVYLFIFLSIYLFIISELQISDYVVSFFFKTMQPTHTTQVDNETFRPLQCYYVCYMLVTGVCWLVRGPLGEWNVEIEITDTIPTHKLSRPHFTLPIYPTLCGMLMESSFLLATHIIWGCNTLLLTFSRYLFRIPAAALSKTVVVYFIRSGKCNNIYLCNK